MMAVRRALEWLFRPFAEDGHRTLARAGRIYLVFSILAALIVPSMILRYGADGWLWHVMASVLCCAPLGVLAGDAIAARATVLAAPGEGEGPRARARGGLRIAALFVGLSLGILLGYALPILFPIWPTPDVWFMARDYQRTMTIVTGVLVGIGGATALLWYRTEAFRLETVAARARYDVLLAQLQPHFLFNSLHSLKELIEIEPREASRMAQALAELYRAILQASKSPTIPLRDELEIVKSYLAVEQFRYGDRLQVAIDVPPALEALQVPGMTVQTLVENAVKHGICKARDGGEVRVIATRAESGALTIDVENTGAPLPPREAPAPGTAGTGLANTRARLRLTYGERASLEIGPHGAATRARLVVPAELEVSA